MTTYLYPEMKSKKAYKEAIAQGKTIIAKEMTPWGSELIENGIAVFSGPHYPKPHRFYGSANVKDGKVVSIK